MLDFQFKNVCIESFGYTVPSEIVSSDEIETRLGLVYQRLKLPEGRLELMTGIKERRFWQKDVRPSQASIASGNRAIEAAAIDRAKIGCMIHGSVCRDFLEPATSCSVHDGLKLNKACVIYDVSNACLGILNGVLQAANMIELKQTEAALVVGSEGGRQLVEGTIDFLNTDTSITRKSIKPAIASLTIGSASCAILLTHKSISKTGNQLNCASVMANTAFHHLCQSDQDQAGSSMNPLMDTDSEELLKQGVATGLENFGSFLANSGWTRDKIDKTVCHQVGIAHQKLMLDALGLKVENDFVTYPWLGNTGSAALPISLAIAGEKGALDNGDNVALLGIGSGINCISIGVEWQKTPVLGAEM